MKTLIIEGFTFKLGENAKDNWNLLDECKPWFLFFHLSSFSSAYGILIVDKDTLITSRLKLLCANTLKEHSKYKSKHIKVDCCPVSNLSKGNKVGEVIYKSNKLVQHIS
jgi:hypothetical protein